MYRKAPPLDQTRSALFALHRSRPAGAASPLPAHAEEDEVVAAQRVAHVDLRIGLAVDEGLHALGRDVHVDVERRRLARDHLEQQVALAECEARSRLEPQHVLSGGVDLELDIAKWRLAHLAGESLD